MLGLPLGVVARPDALGVVGLAEGDPDGDMIGLALGDCEGATLADELGGVLLGMLPGDREGDVLGKNSEGGRRTCRGARAW